MDSFLSAWRMAAAGRKRMAVAFSPPTQLPLPRLLRWRRRTESYCRGTGGASLAYRMLCYDDGPTSQPCPARVQLDAAPRLCSSLLLLSFVFQVGGSVLLSFTASSFAEFLRRWRRCAALSFGIHQNQAIKKEIRKRGGKKFSVCSLLFFFSFSFSAARVSLEGRGLREKK